MSVATVKDFLTSLQTTGLLDQAVYEATCRQWAEGDGASAIVVASQLVESRLLTRWQAQQVLAGRTAFELGPYRLLEVLGAGGMATVYKARHTRTGRIVALKVVARGLLRRRAAIARFQREVQAAVAVNHPHVVAAYGTKCFNGTHVLIMEYVDGPNLEQWQKRFGPLPIAWTCEIIRQAAVGLEHIHQRGLLHRDIKPSNLMVVADAIAAPPVVKIVDLGVARIREQASGNGTALTAQSMLLGTPNYVAPEQAWTNRIADHRADIFSLGCTFFKALTNELPWEGATALQKLVARTQSNAPPVSRLRSEVPPELDAIVARMLAREPDERYATARAVAEELAAWTGCTPGALQDSAPAPRREPNGRAPAAKPAPGNTGRESAGEAPSRGGAKRANETSFAPSTEWLLEKISPGENFERFVLRPASRLMIGRGRDCDIRIDDPLISRRHCALCYESHAWRLDDLGSDNGSFVNGAVAQQRTLSPDDRIQLGNTVLRLAKLDGARQADDTWFGAGFRHETVYMPTRSELADFSPGRLLGKFCELGPMFRIGSTGGYYRGCDRRTGRLVCVKVFWKGSAEDLGEWERFAAGLQTAARLRHPSIVQLYLAGISRGHRWMAMEYVEGQSVRQIVQAVTASRPWSPAQVTSLLRQLAAVLELLRERGVPYINVNPDSIVVTPSGAPKLVNFSPACGLSVPLVDPLTDGCDLSDDLSYMPPERFDRDGVLDHRSDIYALGACGYALLTGRPPFTDRNLDKLIGSIRGDDVAPPSRLNDAVPPALDALIVKCLAKRQPGRFQSPQELADAVRALENARPDVGGDSG